MGLPSVSPFGGTVTKSLAFFKGSFIFIKRLQKQAFDTFYKNKAEATASAFSAERMGFEPTMQLPTYKLSRLAPSTTRTPLYLCCKEQQIFSVKKVSATKY